MASRPIFVAAAFLVNALRAHAASISNCGGASDIFQVSKLSLSPDPIRHREKFTITAEGKLGKAFSGGTVSTKMKLKVVLLGRPIKDDEVDKHTQIELDPAVPAGDVKLIVGPMELPPLPGSVESSGQVAIVDEKGAAVACIAVDLFTPLGSEVAPRRQLPPLGSPQKEITSCAKPGDHLQDVTFSSTPDGWDQVEGTFDESITQLTMNGAFELILGKFPLKIGLTVPVIYEPGFAKGPFKVRAKPAPEALPLPPRQSADKTAADPPPPHLVGDISIIDGKGQEITCVHTDSEPLDSKEIVVV